MLYCFNDFGMNANAMLADFVFILLLILYFLLYFVKLAMLKRCKPICVV